MVLGAKDRPRNVLGMKSAAFNLAFKVHRNEMGLNEGLLKSQQEDAAADFLDALNSLAGEIKFDKSQLSELLEAASSGGGAESEQEAPAGAAVISKLEKSIAALEKDIETLEGKEKNFHESLDTLRNVLDAPPSFILPGINSILVFAVAVVFVLVMYVWKLHPIFPIIMVLLGTAASGLLLWKDLSVYAMQKKELERRRERTMTEITAVEQSLSAAGAKLDEKRRDLEELKSQLSQQQPEAAGAAPDSAVPMTPDALT